MTTTFLNTKTLTMPNVADPSDGYVITFDASQGAYFAKPLSRILAISTPSSPYTVTTEDVVLVPNHVGVFTVNLPVGQTAGKTLYIKDFAGVSAANNILISGNGNNIDGAPNQTLTVNFSGIQVIWSGASWAILSKV
jgi:hypothetical protein